MCKGTVPMFVIHDNGINVRRIHLTDCLVLILFRRRHVNEVIEISNYTMKNDNWKTDYSKCGWNLKMIRSYQRLRSTKRSKMKGRNNWICWPTSHQKLKKSSIKTKTNQKPLLKMIDADDLVQNVVDGIGTIVAVVAIGTGMTVREVVGVTVLVVVETTAFKGTRIHTQ
jgi:hypothetical protein